MDFYEGLGWIALCLNVLGNLDLAKKSIRGWSIRMGCNVAFIIYSFAFGVWPLLANHVIFLFVNLHGWMEWDRDRIHCNCGRFHDKTSCGLECLCGIPIRVEKETIACHQSDY